MGRKAQDTKVGETFEARQDVGKYQAIYYGGASGDFNPIHIDREFGKMVGLGDAILQGLCTMAFTQQANINWAGGDPAKLKKIKVRFAKPVYMGDTIKTSGTVTDMDGNRATTEFVAANQSGVEVITRSTAEVELD
ncbi:hypothetical protein KDL45_00565 [bacterium]|nr:hypothetical protein [bacterium]